MRRTAPISGLLVACLAAIATLLLAPLAAASEPNGSYQPGYVLSPEPPLSDPAGVAVDGSDRFYVADGGSDTVRIFSIGGSNLGSFGFGGLEPLAIPTPLSVALAPDGQAYVGTGGAEAIRVVRFNSEGEPLLAWELPGGLTSLPRGIVATASAVFVADASLDQIHRYDRGGAPEGSFGETTPPHLEGPEAPSGTLAEPSGLALAPDGNLYIADSGNARVQVLSTAGAFLDSWPLPEGSRPASVAVGPDGQVAVAAAGDLAGCILRYGPAGAYRGRVCELGVEHTRGIAIASDRSLLASQTGGEAGLGRARLFTWAASWVSFSDLLTDYAGNRLDIADPPTVSGGF